MLGSVSQGKKLRHFLLDRVAKFTSLCLEQGQGHLNQGNLILFATQRTWANKKSRSQRATSLLYSYVTECRSVIRTY